MRNNPIYPHLPVRLSSLLEEITQLISHLKGIAPKRLQAEPYLASHGLDLVDVVDIIMEVEKTYGLVIPDDVPVENVNDLANYVCLSLRMAS